MRPSKDETWLNVARELARQSTCLRRAVGCVLIDVNGNVSGTGWNGVAPGLPHCNQVSALINRQHTLKPAGVIMTSEPYYPHACAGAKSPSGTNLDGCEAIHAEINALLACKDPWQLVSCYVTTAPCVSCTKALMRTSLRQVTYLDSYPQADAARQLFERASGRSFRQLTRSA